jgi:D-psicose/D-tagatose/L-ribulose 3-epimerase
MPPRSDGDGETNGAAVPNPIGCHGLVWTDQFDVGNLDQVARRTAEAGFELLEVPFMNPWAFDGSGARKVIDAHGLSAVLSVGHDHGSDPTGDAEEAAAAERLLQHAVEVATDLGASQIVGVLYSKLRRYPLAVAPSRRRQSQEILARVAGRAKNHGIQLSLEIVNRYETNVINTLADTASYIEGTGSDNIKMHIDSFHMNIEEADMYSPVVKYGDLVGYVHVSENTRGYLGSGGVAFDQLFRALAQVCYTGPVTFETFSPDLLKPDFAGLLALWRPFYKDPDDLGRHAVEFIRNKLRAAQTVMGGQAS